MVVCLLPGTGLQKVLRDPGTGSGQDVDILTPQTGGTKKVHDGVGQEEG